MLNPIALIASESAHLVPEIEDLTPLPSAGLWMLLALQLPAADIERYADITQQDASWLSWALARQHRALESLSESVPVYPLQFGLIVPSAEEMLGIAESQNAALKDYFALISGASEWGIKAALNDVADDPSAIPEPVSGLAWLKAKQAAPEQRRRRIESAMVKVQEVLNDLLAFGRAKTDVQRQAVVPAKQRLEIVNSAILVDKQMSEAFLNCARKNKAQLAQEGIEFTVSGPWPPYSFRPRLLKD